MEAAPALVPVQRGPHAGQVHAANALDEKQPRRGVRLHRYAGPRQVERPGRLHYPPARLGFVGQTSALHRLRQARRSSVSRIAAAPPPTPMPRTTVTIAEHLDAVLDTDRTIWCLRAGQHAGPKRRRRGPPPPGPATSSA